METLLIVIHLMVVLALVGVILLQKSEGGGLDVGGGSGFMTARSAANTLTRVTAILATIFFVTSLALSLLARYGDKPIDILDRAPVTNQGQSQTQGKGVLDQLPGSTAPAAPKADANAPSVPTGTEETAPANPPASGTTAPAANGTTEPAAPQVPNQ
ncbi:MAG: preprotein translocase subunit SecG [Mesorhizobium sp.]